MRPFPVFRVVAAVLLLAPGWSGDVRLPLLCPDAEIRAERVSLFKDSPRTRLGRLTFLGGVALSSRDPAFGGFSALRVDGDRFTLLSDGGNIVRFRMGPDWRVRTPSFGMIPAGPGTGWDKRDRDTESFTADPTTNTTWVGFEGANAIYRFRGDLAAVTGIVRPRAMRKWSANSGAESLVRLRDGSFVAISEAHVVKGRRGVSAIHFATDPVKAPNRGYRFRYLPPKGYLPTDVAELPDGDLLVINRRFAPRTLFTARLVRIARHTIRPGAVVRGSEVARFGGDALHDNFEGLAVVQEGGRTILWIVSDDNQTFFERSLLLKFAL